MKSNVVLVGMPGAGKSTLGVVLAKIINKRFLDVDLLIQERHGATLQQLINERGAEGFIELENEALCSIEVENTIIATGGSAIYSEEAIRHLAQTGTIVYLEISYESLVERLGDLDERGVVMRGGQSMGLRELYDERRPLYEHAAEIVVNVDNLSITNAARKVAASINDAPEA
jgi:shikimate kinase